MRKVIVVGASSGIGFAVAERLLSKGMNVACVSRRETFPAGGRHYQHDVHDWQHVPALFDKIAMDFGGIDGIIYAAGILPSIPASIYATDTEADIIAVNLTGAVAWLNEAARRFEIAGAGTIVGISSVAGERGRRTNGVYASTKAALNCYLESLRNRIERRGCVVITVKPGPVRTPMTEGLRVPGMVSVSSAADDILRAIGSGTREVYVPAKWKVIMTVLKLIPSPLFKHLNI